MALGSTFGSKHRYQERHSISKNARHQLFDSTLTMIPYKQPQQLQTCIDASVHVSGLDDPKRTMQTCLQTEVACGQEEGKQEAEGAAKLRQHACSVIPSMHRCLEATRWRSAAMRHAIHPAFSLLLSVGN